MSGIMSERLVMAVFPMPYTVRKVERITRKFIETVSDESNGFAVRLDSVGLRRIDQVPYNVTQAVLALWYPTEDEAIAPISAATVKAQYKGFLGNPKKHLSMPVYFWETESPVVFDHNDGLIAREVMTARKLFMYRHDLRIDESRPNGMLAEM